MKKSKISDVDEAYNQGILNDDEVAKMKEAQKVIQKTIAVDHFSPDQFSPRVQKRKDKS